MKYALVISILINLWFQFQGDIFAKYVNAFYCPNSKVEGVQFSEYSFFELRPLHIPYVIQVDCKP